MENQGYEEEHLRGKEEEAFSCDPFEVFPMFTDRASERDLDDKSHPSKTHVYEDVLCAKETETDPAISVGKAKEEPEVFSISSNLSAEDDALERKLTLPIRRGARVNFDPRSSCPDRGERISRKQSLNESGRRRKKKDCKHCRNKANREKSCEEKTEEKTEIFAITLNSDVNGKENYGLFSVPDKLPAQCEESRREETASVMSEKEKNGMRINSIYSQDRWYAKETPLFFLDVDERPPFQRAYSLPNARAQTPSSQNRVNLRRSVRGEPAPHPARLQKHRHGWTLHLTRPVQPVKRKHRCNAFTIFLLTVVLVLLGVGAVALYIAFEPEQLRVIQQYLISSGGNSTQNLTHEVDLIPAINETETANALFNEVPSSSTVSTETESSERSFRENSTRYCDDCLPEEVCVALADEDVPICRTGRDPEDPTGCAGFCLINKQKCHRLDVDAFRCVNVERYCLEDEWTCSNTLCIPLKRRCDGHMNCYDHSDEYNCTCNLDTHFQCGNETSCLPLVKRCDGKIDCWDASDEINCTLACPLETEFTCSNGECILKTRFCDGLADCTDGSDEPHGCQGRCNKHEFTCQNNRCITKGMKCNGVDDCGDGTDERYCKEHFI